MAVDIIATIVVLWGLLRGWLRGFIYQIGQIGMLAVAFIVGRGLGSLAEPWFAELELMAGTDPRLHTLAAFSAVFLAVYLIGLLVLRSFSKDVHEASETLSAADRTLGLIVGGLKYGAAVYVTFVALIMANQATGKVPVPYGSSVVGRWVMQHNFLESEEFPRARALVKLGWIMHSRSASELVDNPHFTAILEHPKAEVLRTPAVSAALKTGDWVGIISDEKVWDLLDEPDIQEHLNAIEWDGAQAPGSEPEAPDPRPPPAPKKP